MNDMTQKHLQMHRAHVLPIGWRSTAARRQTNNYLGVILLLAYPLLLCGLIQSAFGVVDYVFFKDGVEQHFILPGTLAVLASALVLRQSNRALRHFNIHYRDAMLFVSLTWILCSIDAAIPIFLVENVSFTDAVFEAASALTTTGATILSGLDTKAPTLLMYRQFLQWLGGLGVVIFVVAILPMLNIGGLRVFKAETPGPMKNEKLTPRIAESARALWFVYVWLTLGGATAYWLAGMSWFDAFAHSFSTVSTGGFSTHDASIGYFNSRAVEGVADIFMLLGAINFGLHYRFLFKRNPGIYFRDEETHVFLVLIILASVLVTLTLLPLETNVPASGIDKFLTGLFHVVSFMTSTGFGAGSYTEWPPVTILLLIAVAYLGGCSGSTAGGSKIVRIIIATRLVFEQFRRLVHPNGVFAIKYNKRVIESDIRDATMAFLWLSIILSLLLTLSLMATGLDFLSSLSAVAACLNVLGPAFGVLGSNFAPVSDTGTWILTFTMLLGRLEFFTLLVLLSRKFWRN